MIPLSFRLAKRGDIPQLAGLNAQLILDEGHRNPMDLAALTERMARWLDGDYEGVLIEDGSNVVGYALYRSEPEFVYLRQLFVVPERRRQGIARQTLRWLWDHAWQDAARLRIEVLVDNAAGRLFWMAMGFNEYCITMEAARPTDGETDLG
ncbi:MAG: GNAT family N-acetyltransferase [Planctomycetota bacterium]|nr:MAG: GNAT family N-acetyltransferase [Planctomycetota bacterium]